MNIRAIFSDKNYIYIGAGILAGTAGLLAIKQYINNGQRKEVAVCATIIIGTTLAYQAARIYMYSRQFAKATIKSPATK